ncbi:hypothetical protein [Pseudonocardia charpentierae]|uniref:Uncharacterized protein n=1 Tax=Pseudonocardia charpentierae TaxID=3075545 RepID=A0ABU2NI07_9PSEU|nr:hypothetical protein [Pseudonocardia sp. DSM 45834]MDT0353595.1 hypothetical protein [Pseudonocardia sp. DSM 45834]
MTAITQPVAVNLSAEDRARMARLYEEVRGRIAEMARIASRVLGLEEKDGKIVFAPVLRDQARAVHMNFDESEAIEIVCTPSGCGCYDHHAGTCGPC